LATVYGIVKQSGGFIWVYSEAGLGTAFKIYLPRVDEPVELAEPTKNADGAVHGTETILLAEDEDDLRELVWGGLRKNGYTVLEARNGIEALQVAKHHDGPIHLLMTDVVMPKMGGWKLAERLITLRPALAVVYLSGYSEYSAAPDDSSKWRASFVQKPFAMDALARKIREVLSPDRR